MCNQFSDQYLQIQRARVQNHLRDNERQRRLAQNAITQIRRIKDLAGPTVPVIVALLPDENQINPDLQKLVRDVIVSDQLDFQMPQSMLVQLFRAIEILTIDLLPIMRTEQRCLYLNDTHWNSTGHEIAAATIFERLKPFIKNVKSLR